MIFLLWHVQVMRDDDMKRYPAPYDCYDMTDADPAFMASPGSGFFALTDERGLKSHACLRRPALYR